MKKFLISLAALGAVAATAAPAAAQPWRDDGYRPAYAQQPYSPRYIDGLNWRIDSAAREGRISWGEARGLRDQLQSVRGLAWRSQSGRLDPEGYQRLSWVVRRVEMRTTNYGYGDRGNRYGGYDRGDYGRYGDDWRR